MDGSFGKRVETILRMFWVVLFEELVYKSSFVENYGNNFRLFIGGHFELWKKINSTIVIIQLLRSLC
jgi:hypothetical protein